MNKNKPCKPETEKGKTVTAEAEPVPSAEQEHACNISDETVKQTDDIKQDDVDRATIPTEADKQPLDAAERAELEEYRRQKQAFLKERSEAMERKRMIDAEFREFEELFPDEVLPDEVLATIGKGIPIAASYALYLKRKERTERINLENERRASCRLEATPNNYFSPAEVRRMSAAEVKQNYNAIMQSMQAWR